MDAFIARQPIFDQKLDVYGYELLFRSGLENAFDFDDMDQATRKVISDSCFLFDVETYSGGRRSFVNTTRDVLIQGHVTLLPPEITVAEIAGALTPDDEILEACRQLKEAGYLMALDNLTDDQKSAPLLRFIDIVKVDFLNSSESERARIAQGYSQRGIRLVAQKVETVEAFKEAQDLEYDFFQGFFFKVPVIVRSKDIPGFRLHYFQLLSQIHKPEFDIPKLESIIKKDVSLTYKLLRYMNSAFFGMRTKVESVRHALLLLGARETRKWATLVTITGMTKDKPPQLLIDTLIRAKFFESLASPLGFSHRSEELFMMGMLSTIDVILGRPLNELVRTLPISDDIKDALCGKKNQLRGAIDCILAYEQADWEELAEQTNRLALTDIEMGNLYHEALQWANGSLGELLTAA
jgi:EAL and modified HD-GYP domain-containing signal transduction protein